MNALAQQQRKAGPARQDDLLTPVFLQRSGQGPAAFIAGVENVLASGGSPLPSELRGDMESRFDRDFSSVRVHDDAHAHDSARDAQAAAYAVGNHIVFGSGRYNPDSGAGRHLLAHELAHTVQQGGLQRKSLDGMALDDNAELEHEADRAAGAALRGAAPASLSSVQLPRLARLNEAEAAAPLVSEDQSPDTESSLQHLDFIRKYSYDQQAGNLYILAKPLQVPAKKGRAEWVEPIWTRYAKRGNLFYTTRVSGSSVESATKESSVTEEYKAVWAGRHGFASMQEVGKSVKAWAASDDSKAIDASLRKSIAAAGAKLAKNDLKGSGANIDHIVEKQVGGNSVGDNMQILNASDNSSAGSTLKNTVRGQGEDVVKAMKGKKVKLLRIRYDEVLYAPQLTSDALDKIEELLRAKQLKPVGGGKELQEGEGASVTLQAGGATQRVFVDRASPSINLTRGANAAARFLVPNLDLQEYLPVKGDTDSINAGIDQERVKSVVPGKKKIVLDVRLGTAASGASGELRLLSISGKTKGVDFFFPYLSPGEFTKLELAADNSLTAEGYISPTLKFLKRIDVSLTKDSFKLKGNLGPENFKPPFNGFKVTESSLALQLAPEFKPSGTFKFQVGPETKPYVQGEVTAGLEGGTFAVNGTLEGKNIPGVKEAVGKVRYTQNEGWSGELKANSSKLPRTKKTEVIFGFRTAGEITQFYASGAIQFDIGAGKDLTINAGLRGERLVYSGMLIWEKPIKLVDKVELGFSYDDDLLTGSGSSDITYKKFDGKLNVDYRKKGDEEARLSGKGAVKVKTDKAEGMLELHIDPNGVISGKGSVSYVFSDKIKPTVGVILHPDGHLTLTGKIEITQPIQLFPRFPKDGGERDLIKLNLDMIIPGPFPGLADPMMHLGAGVRFSYGIGPGQIVNTVIEGSFDPLEENKNAKLKFTSTFEVPGHVGLTGILEAGLGVAVLGGLAAKAHAGLRIEPGFTLKLVTRMPIAADYDNGDFSFEGKLEMHGGLSLGLAIKLYAHVEAAAGALEKEFIYDIKNYTYDVGQQMTLTVAKLGYSTRTGFKPPSLDDIKISPGNIDPIEMIKKVAGAARNALEGQA
jgi:hypothetical protein